MPQLKEVIDYSKRKKKKRKRKRKDVINYE